MYSINSIYRITLILSVYRNWYLHGTINKLFMFVYTWNQTKYLIVYNLQICNLFVYTNATGSCFCFYFINVNKLDNAAGTKPKFEIKQTNISANMEIKIQKLRLQELYQANKMQTRKEINCNDVLRDQTTYSSTSL